MMYPSDKIENSEDYVAVIRNLRRVYTAFSENTNLNSKDYQ